MRGAGLEAVARPVLAAVVRDLQVVHGQVLAGGGGQQRRRGGSGAGALAGAGRVGEVPLQAAHKARGVEAVEVGVLRQTLRAVTGPGRIANKQRRSRRRHPSRGNGVPC